MEWKNCKRHCYEAVSSALISYIKCLLPTLFGASCRCNRQEMSLYTEKRNLSCSCFLNTSPMQHSCDYYKVTTSQSHHFPLSPLPFVTTSHRHHFPSPPLPFLTTSLRHQFPSSPLPFHTTSLRHRFPKSPHSLSHHFPSSPLPIVTSSLRHHFP